MMGHGEGPDDLVDQLLGLGEVEADGAIGADHQAGRFVEGSGHKGGTFGVDLADLS
jgi:hypothetical protein